MNQKKRGLQRAVEALKREGAVRLTYIKSKEFQGFSLEIDPTLRFHLGSKREVYGIVKRGQTVIPRHYGLTVAPRYSEPPPRSVETEDRDIDAMRRYMNASPEDRAEIDRFVEDRVGRLLGTMSADKHAGLWEEARLECIREHLGAKSKEGKS
jgi:hypothetical protein